MTKKIIASLLVGISLPVAAIADSTCNTSVTIPLHFQIDQPLPLMKGKINDKDGVFLFDLGATSTHVIAKSAEKFNLKTVSLNKRVSGISGTEQVSVTKIDSLKFEGITLKEQYFYVLENIGFKPYFDAILGADTLLEHPLEVDIQKAYFKIYTNPLCNPIQLRPNKANYIEIQTEVQNSADPRLVFIAEIEKVKVSAIFDTAASISTITSQSFAKIEKTNKVKSFNNSKQISGIGGTITARTAKLNELIIGGKQFNDIEIRILPTGENTNKTKPELILGLNFLRRYTVIFSPQKNKIYLMESGD